MSRLPLTEPPVRRYPLFSLSDARIRFMACVRRRRRRFSWRIRIRYKAAKWSVDGRGQRKAKGEEAVLVHPREDGRTSSRMRTGRWPERAGWEEERCSRGEFKSNFDIGKSGRRREGSDGSLRSFDRELKARSRQFSDATFIVTMGDGVRSSLSLFILSLSLSLSFCLCLSFSLWSLWHEPRISLRLLVLLRRLHLLPLSFSARVHPPVFLFHFPPPP